MRLDKQTALEMVEAVLWWQDKVARLWNMTLGHVLGKTEVRDLSAEKNNKNKVCLLESARTQD